MIEARYLGIVLMYQILFVFSNIVVLFMIYKIIDMGLDMLSNVFFKGRDRYIVRK